MSEQVILIAEDEQMIAELERDYLEASGYHVDIAADGKECIRKFMSGSYDMVLLDVMLPEVDGFEICRTIRMSSNVPVMMITARKEDIDKIRGLGLGADDYMVKPFSPPEMVARVKAHIGLHERLSGTAPVSDGAYKAKVIRNGGLAIHPDEFRVFMGEKEILLVKKEFELLLFFAENLGIVFSKDNLFEKVWGIDAIGDTSTVTVHIKRLRDKLRDAGAEDEYIETVWGTGYRMKAIDK